MSVEIKKWDIVPLLDAVEIFDALRKPISAKERQARIAEKKQSELYPYYGATGQVGYIDDYLIDGEYILLGEDGAPFLDAFAKKAYIIKGKSWVNNHAHILRSKTNNRFLYFYLNYFNYKGYVSGTTRLKLTQAQMKTIPVPVPSVDEQAHIVARIEELFSTLDASVAELQTAKERLKVYRQAVLKDAFSDVPLDEYKLLRTVFSDLPQNGLYKPKTAYGSGTRILRIDGFYDGRILNDYDFKRLELNESEIEQYQLNKWDLVVNRVNSMPYLGKCALVRDLTEITVYESNMMRIRLDSTKVDPEYVTYYLSSFAGRKELTKNAKQAVNQASINQTDVGNALIPVPDNLEYQRKMVYAINARISVCNNIEQTIDTAMQQAEVMRQSILKQAFEGRM